MKEYRNVLHYAGYSSPYKGNFIASLEMLESELENKNHKMFYLFPEMASKREWAVSKENAKFLTGNFSKDLKLINDIVKNNEIDIIHIHFYSFKTLLLFKLLRLPCKKIVHLHGMNSKYKGMKKFIMRQLFKNTDVIGCGEVVTNNFLLKKEVDSISCVRNAIYFPRLDEYKEYNLKINSNDFVILMFGFDYKRKGVDLVIKAVMDIRKKYNITLAISLSSNKEKVMENIRNEVNEIPEFIKFVEPINDIATYYKNADVFISSSRSEGFCYSLVEAAYSGCAIIASDIPEQKEVEIDNILWFESENVEELKNCIVKCIENQEKYKKEIINQREYIKNKYDIKVWAEKIIEQYEKI